ncbi:MAG TPA: HNH endonuclease [Candidatus Dormibacteraeota bacterium]
MPATKCSGHHIRHWAHGGQTTLPNLGSLCGFHHRRYHAGGFSIGWEADELVFRRPDGSKIEPPEPPPPQPLNPPGRPRAGWHGERLALDDAIYALDLSG